MGEGVKLLKDVVVLFFRFGETKPRVNDYICDAYVVKSVQSGLEKMEHTTDCVFAVLWLYVLGIGQNVRCMVLSNNLPYSFVMFSTINIVDNVCSLCDGLFCDVSAKGVDR